MSTKKPLLKTYVSTEIYQKIKLLAEKENRSISNYLETIIEKEISNYEKENGEINV